MVGHLEDAGAPALLVTIDRLVPRRLGLCVAACLQLPPLAVWATGPYRVACLAAASRRALQQFWGRNFTLFEVPDASKNLMHITSTNLEHGIAGASQPRGLSRRW
ncbi:hypothetical protein AB595_09070 [Massilia sp. WF1]|nr:hypothetical protein AB595_09070 [Massilia sp. WF1]